MAPHFEQFALEAVLADSNQVVAVVDPEMIVRWVSPSASAYGIEVRGRSLVDLIHPDDIERAAQAFDDAVRVGAIEPSAMANSVLSVRIMMPTGAVPFDVSGRWVIDEAGNEWLVAILQNVTTRFATDQVLRRLAAGADERQSIEAIVASAREFGAIQGAQMMWQSAREQFTFGDLGTDPHAVIEVIGELSELALPGRAVDVPASEWAFAFPVVAGRERLGSMVVWGQGRVPHQALVLAVMTPLLDLTAVALKRTRELAELERRATTDQITGLLNRHAFASALDRVVHRAAIIYIDLDDFKSVNDQYGHTLGDRLLHVVGRRLADALGDDDLVGRIGGDEFAVFCDAVSGTEAQRAGERVVAALNHVFVIDGHRISTGASVGVAFTEAETSGRELIDTADRALLKAKALGKGQAVVLAHV